MYKDFILSVFSKDKNTGIRLYKGFVLKENSEDITRTLGSVRVPPILGNDRFMKWVKENFFNKKYGKEVPESKSLAPSVEEIRSAVCKFYGIDEKELLGSKRSVSNEPRKIAIYLAR